MRFLNLFKSKQKEEIVIEGLHDKYVIVFVIDGVEFTTPEFATTHYDKHDDYCYLAFDKASDRLKESYRRHFFVNNNGITYPVHCIEKAFIRKVN